MVKHGIYILLLTIVTAITITLSKNSKKEKMVLELKNQSLHQQITAQGRQIQTLEKKLKSTALPFPKQIFELQQENRQLKSKINTLLQKNLYGTPRHTNSSLQVMRMATGGRTGVYFQVGKSVKYAFLNDNNFKFEIVESPGAAQNIIFISSGRVELALTQLDSILDFQTSPATKSLVRSTAFIAPLFEESIHILVNKDSFPTSSSVIDMKQLQGKKVNIGPVGSGTRISVTRLLKIANVDIDTLKLDGSFLISASKKLLTGKLDAVFCIMGTPSPFLKKLPANIIKKVRILSLPPYVLKKISAHPEWGYNVVKIKKGSYWEPYDLHTISTPCLLIIKRRIKRNVVVKILTSFFGHKKDLLSHSDKWRFLTRERLAKHFRKFTRFYHPGVKKFLNKNRGQ